MDVSVSMCGMIATAAWVGCVDRKQMLFNGSVGVLVVQVSVVQIVDVIVVPDGRMAAAFAMCMVRVVTI